ncbi:hypothetical protein [Kordiimonas aestuarii]|uniref:hypothetical protein n=1 Tax=Kordiimonas aestuarii TaxID=1005925 RepID=UPI0021D1E66F|nr:hypothetical protein [Kordiimonas aestuarii]
MTLFLRFAAALFLLSGFVAHAAPPPTKMLAQMRAAYGGEKLMSLTSARMTLHLQKVGEELPHVTELHYDLRGRSIGKSETTEAGVERKIAGAGRSYSFIRNQCMPLEERDEEKLMGSLYSNFLFLLSDSQTILAPPEGTPPSGDIYSGLAWYNIFRPGWKGFHIGVDEATGLIRALWYGEKSTGEELDYQMVDGVMWPHRFKIYEGDRLLSEGYFNNVMLSRSGDDGIKVPDYCMQLLTPR